MQEDSYKARRSSLSEAPSLFIFKYVGRTVVLWSTENTLGVPNKQKLQGQNTNAPRMIRSCYVVAVCCFTTTTSTTGVAASVVRVLVGSLKEY
jgi:hypothetical protein